MSYSFANMYDIYHCCVYSQKLLMMDRGTFRNTQSFIQKRNKFDKLVRLVMGWACGAYGLGEGGV